MRRVVARPGRAARGLLVGLCAVTLAALSPVGPAPTRAAPAAAECAHAWDPLLAAAVARGRREMPCPSTAPFAVAAAIQPFERGAMLWLADNPVVFRIEAEAIGGPRIVVIRNDSFRLFPDRFEEGQPEQLGLVPPAPGLLEPRRGFGKVWREQQAAGVTETVKTVPDEIGWATEPERGFTALMQGFHGQSWAMQLGEGWACSTRCGTTTGSGSTSGPSAADRGLRLRLARAALPRRPGGGLAGRQARPRAAAG